MRFIYLIILLAGSNFVARQAIAQIKTEKDLVQEIITILQTGDDSAYANLFPPITLMSEAINNYQPKDSFQLSRINRLRSNMRHLMEFDPEHNTRILDMMNFVRKKGSDSGVHWGDIFIAKYEFDKQRLPPELIGFELIAPLRMQGYIFIRDMLTRKRYGIAVRDIFLINEEWYGGLILNILEGSTATEFEESLAIEQRELRQLMIAKRNGVLDSVLAARDSIKNNKEVDYYDDEDEEEDEMMYKDITDRKLYTGYFDKLEEVSLYIRYIKGTCPEQICSWEAMYKFGDMKDYIIVSVERKPDGTFVFSEEEQGVMELRLKGDTFTGTWTSSRDKTEYEAYLKEKVEIRDRKLYKLDKTYELTRWQ